MLWELELPKKQYERDSFGESCAGLVRRRARATRRTGRAARKGKRQANVEKEKARATSPYF